MILCNTQFVGHPYLGSHLLGSPAKSYYHQATNTHVYVCVGVIKQLNKQAYSR